MNRSKRSTSDQLLTDALAAIRRNRAARLAALPLTRSSIKPDVDDFVQRAAVYLLEHPGWRSAPNPIAYAVKVASRRDVYVRELLQTRPESMSLSAFRWQTSQSYRDNQRRRRRTAPNTGE